MFVYQFNIMDYYFCKVLYTTELIKNSPLLVAVYNFDLNILSFQIYSSPLYLKR